MTKRIPAQIKRCYHQSLLSLAFKYPDRQIVKPIPRFIPAPELPAAHKRSLKKVPFWVSGWEDNGTVITVAPYRELFDDPSCGVYDLSNWILAHGDGTSSRPQRENRSDLYRVEPKLSKEEEELKRREIARALFPRMSRKVRKQFFSDEVQSKLSDRIMAMTRTAVVERMIHDCDSDREDYSRYLQYRSYYIASFYEEGKPGKDGRPPASLVTYIKDALVNSEIDFKRNRFRLRSLVDLFPVAIDTCAVDSSEDKGSYAMISEEALEGRYVSVEDMAEMMDINSLQEYLALPKNAELEKVYNHLVYDGYSQESVAKEMNIPESTFRYRYLEPLRKICREFGFCPRSERNS